MSATRVTPEEILGRIMLSQEGRAFLEENVGRIMFGYPSTDFPRGVLSANESRHRRYLATWVDGRFRVTRESA